MRHIGTLSKQQPARAQFEALSQLVNLLQGILGFLSDLWRYKTGA